MPSLEEQMNGPQPQLTPEEKRAVEAVCHGLNMYMTLLGPSERVGCAALLMMHACSIAEKFGDANDHEVIIEYAVRDLENHLRFFLKHQKPTTADDVAAMLRDVLNGR